MTEGRGQAEIWLPLSAVSAACVILDGFQWHGQQLCAWPIAEAHAKFRVQRRMRDAMKILRGPAKGLRSFHNFMSDTRAGDPAAMRQLQHCSAGSIFSDVRRDIPSRKWAHSDWTRIVFSASDFGPQQLRRMAGALVAVVCGADGLEYLECCFRTLVFSLSLACRK